jgi:hypothetical protein
LPDFVFGPQNVRKGNATRELGDGTIVVGHCGLAIQVKSRVLPAEPVADRESNWILKKVAEATRQARGSVRCMTNDLVLINARGREVEIRSQEISWVGVVIVDHDDPPHVTIPTDEEPLKVVSLLRRDWEFLFDQLRSTSAVVRYIHRVSARPPVDLGSESSRYFELAGYDRDAPPGELASWVRGLGGRQVSTPLLPTIPVSNGDELGLTVFREILEDIANSAIDQPESDRLMVLAALDNYAVAERGALGRRLFDQLQTASETEPNGPGSWNAHRVFMAEQNLQLLFVVSNWPSEMIEQGLHWYVHLKHDDFAASDGETSMSVAVLLTPRKDGRRRWDTTLAAMKGPADLDPEVRALYEQLWCLRSAVPDDVEQS